MPQYFYCTLQVVRFVNPIPYHLNVDQSTGQICIGILKADNWNPATSCMENVLHGVAVALTNPQQNSFVDDEVYRTYVHQKSVYEEKARCSVKRK